MYEKKIKIFFKENHSKQSWTNLNRIIDKKIKFIDIQ